MKGLLSRLARAASEDLRFLTPPRIVGQIASRTLPQQSFGRLRTLLFRAAGVQIGPRSLILGPLRVTGTGSREARLSIGSDSLLSGNLHVDLGAAVRIGDRVQIGHDVSLLTINHALGSADMRAGAHEFGPIRIDDGVWIASRVVVLPGVTIGRGAVVAAGAVVTRDVPPNTLVAGVPARVVRELPSANRSNQ